MSDEPPVASVVVATFRRPDRVVRLLEALAKQTMPPDQFEVIVVDDCSGDDTAEVLAAMTSQVPFRLTSLSTPANRGPGPARNIGWRASSAPYVAFTDDDCVPDPAWLESVVTVLADDPTLGLVQGMTIPADLVRTASDSSVHSIHQNQATPFFETCNIAYRRAALEQGGGFGEDHNWWGGWFCEDTFGGWRVVDAGWGRTFTADAVVVHDVAERGLKWLVDKALMQYVEVAVAARHPGFRREAYWRSWAPRREDAAHALAVGGVLLGLKWRPAIVLAMPYVVWGRPSIKEPRFLARCARTAIVDSARTASILYGAVRERTFVV